ncbi:MAG: flavoprotein [Pseudomonas fluorescens]
MNEPTTSSRVLYLVICGSPRARKISDLIDRAHHRGWTVYVAATPMGLQFLDVPAVEHQTETPVRSEYAIPSPPEPWPPADAILVCPATFNTINKWATGIADTLALSIITEANGLPIPIVAAPALNNAQEQHPAFRRSTETLRAMGVAVIYGPGLYEPTAPGTGGRPYNFDLPLDALEPGQP